MDSSLHLVPGRFKLPTAPGGSLRKDGPGWEKAENKFTATSACVCVLCVCPVSPPKYARVCCCVSFVRQKKLTEVSLVCLFVCLLSSGRAAVSCLGFFQYPRWLDLV